MFKELEESLLIINEKMEYLTREVETVKTNSRAEMCKK